MKKIYTTPEGKLYQKRIQNKRRKEARRRRRILKRIRHKIFIDQSPDPSKGNPINKKSFKNKISASLRTEKKRKTKQSRPKNFATIPIYAPLDFRLIENTEKCLDFFRTIRNEANYGSGYVLISLALVNKIDYGTISILTAISDDLRFKGINLRGDFPIDKECKQFMIDSGFLAHMYDSNNRKFPKADKSDLIFFEKGSEVLSTEDNKKISEMVKRVVFTLTGESKHCLPVKTIILEICGNSIEWGGTENKQWLLGVKYETDKVVFTVTDVGKGVLETLHRKFKLILQDELFRRKNDVILKGAFDKKYGSNTQEVNRNKGLPSVKVNFERGTIQNLKVITNNVILHFGNEELSRTFPKGSAWFRGTLYQWEMTKKCIFQTSID